MSILGKIFSRILPHANAGQPAPATPAVAQPAARPAAQAARQPAPQSIPQPPPQTTAQAASQQPAAAAATATMERVDIEKVLDNLAGNNQQKLNWRSSIVDLMKVVGMESTLQERKELADELGYTGDKADTARMNTWLHKEVMRKLEENGGKVPDNLK